MSSKERKKVDQKSPSTKGSVFVQHLNMSIRTIRARPENLLNLIAWLGNASNGIGEFFAQVGNFQTTNATTTNTQTLNASTVCVAKSDGSPVCITGDQLAALLAAQGTNNSDSNQSPSAAQQSPAAGSNPPESVTQNSASTTAATPPTITINGDNPAIITVGDSYADLGATVTDTGPGQAGDTNLGFTTFLNGTLVSNIVIDTSEVATDTVQYVATDTAGLTATSTRTVLIEPVPEATTSATSTATSTTQ